MAIKTHVTEIHERKIKATLDERTIHQLLAKAVADEHKLNIEREDVKYQVLVKERGIAGTAGIERYAEVTVTIDTGPGQIAS